MADSIRWGVLGTGRIIGKAGEALRRTGNGVWYGIAGRSEQSSRLAADTYGLPRRYRDYQELLEDPDIDAVYIALLNHLHKEWAVKACRAGKHVLLEKPFALTLQETEEIISAAEKHGVQVQEAMVWRHHPGHQAVKEMLLNGEIGEWVRFRAHFSSVHPEGSTRWNAAWGGGAMYDIGCYPVAWARYLTGSEPLAADAVLQMHPIHGVDARVAATLYYPEGKTAQFDAALDLPHGSYYELLGTKGRLQVNITASLTEMKVICKSGTEVKVWATDRIEPFRIQAERFAADILATGQLSYGAEEARRQSRVMDALFASSRQNRRIYF